MVAQRHVTDEFERANIEFSVFLGDNRVYPQPDNA